MHPNVSHGYITVNNVRLHYVEAGSGTPVLLLHGFPECWYSWRYQISALSKAGFRVIAVDMRGFNLSEKPQGISAYNYDIVSKDILGLIDEFCDGKGRVIARDWGGIMSWFAAMRSPEKFEKLIILNAPHPARFADSWKTWSQFWKSFYCLLHQLRCIPEFVWRWNDYALLRYTFRAFSIHPSHFTDRDLLLLKEAVSQPGALTAGLNYYRACRYPFGLSTWKNASRTIDIPTMVIWGEHDAFLGLQLLQKLDKWVQNLRIERVPDAGHFVQEDVPQYVNRLLTEFLL